VPPTLSCPEIPEIERPVPQVGPEPRFPYLPEDLHTLSGDEQTRVLIDFVGQAAGSYSECILDRRALLGLLEERR
jgi:hypothetical protein